MVIFILIYGFEAVSSLALTELAKRHFVKDLSLRLVLFIVDLFF